MELEQQGMDAGSPQEQHLETQPVGGYYLETVTPSSDPNQSQENSAAGRGAVVHSNVATHARPLDDQGDVAQDQEQERSRFLGLGLREEETQRRHAAQVFSSVQRPRAQNLPPEQQLIESARKILGLNQARRQKDTFRGYVAKTLTSAPFHPLRLAQRLISMGYEPVPPRRQYSIVYQQYRYYYPGIIGYFKGIIQQDGWRALYRGLGNSIIDEIVTLTVHSVVQHQVAGAVKKLPLSIVSGNGDVPDTEENVETTRAIAVRAVRMLIVSCITQTTVEILVRPFHVIVVRSIAQHVGKETLYSTIWGAAKEIYQEEGLSGFYAGIIPAILGHICSCFLYSALWFGFELVAINTPYNWAKMVIRGLVEVPMLAYFPRSYCYPFSLMSTLMAVNNCRLKAGIPPQMPIFNGWRECYRYLSMSGLMYRGSMIIFPRFAYKSPPS